MTLEKIVDTCSYLLRHSQEAEEAKSYLNGRLSAEMQELFQFGFFPPFNSSSLLTSFIDEETLRKMELLYTKEIFDSNSARNIDIYFFEHHPLIMPYKDVYGNIVALVGRSLLNDDERKNEDIAKYKNTNFKKGEHVFGLYEAKKYILKSGFVYVVEGQFDVIKAFEKGLRNIVAVGNSNITGTQLSLISRYTKNIILLFDNDEAGELGRRRAMNKFSNLANLTANTYLPNGYKDIDEYFQIHDSDSMSLITTNNYF